MFKWAWKSLFNQSGHLLGSALGIASAFILVIFFDSVWRGESVQVVAYPDNMKPDIWVMQSGVGNMHMAMSFIWDWKAKKIEKIEGVKKVTPILYTSSIITVNNKEMFAFIVGLLPGTQRAGPWEMSAGRQIENPGEVLIPDVLSKIGNINIGDSLQIIDQTFTVTGLTKGTFSSANTVLFVPFSNLDKILSSSGTYSYLLVDTEESIDAKKLAQKIKNDVAKVNALTHKEFIANDLSMAKQMGVEIIVMMTIICSVLAALIVAFTSYSLIMRKRKELAIIKALGVNNRTVLYSVTAQSIIVTLSGFILATAFAIFIIPTLPQFIPQLTLLVSIDAIIQLGLIALIVSIAGALIPAYMVLRVDPATAFHV